jgi:NADH-ubiquinone oxidoreductase chain 5
MLIPLFILSLFSIFSGYLFKDMFIGIGTTFWNNSIFISTKSKLVSDCEFLPNYIKILPLIFSFLGISLILFFNLFSVNFIFKTRVYYYVYSFLNNKWYFDRFFNYYINSFIIRWSLLFFLKEVDKGFVELLAPKGLVFLSYVITKELKQVYYGRYYIYISFIILSGFLILGYFYLHVKFV